MTTFMLPFPDKVLTGHFGKIRTINGKKTNPHRGTDWAPKLGAPIPAVSDGTVMLVQYSKVLGWVVVQSVKGFDGKVMYVGYCHMDTKPAYKVGHKLKMGDIIGKVGNEGFSSGPHLHATLSDTVKGVFAGTVYDLYKYLSEQIKMASKAKPAGQKSSATPKKETKSAKPAICPTCGQEVKK
jgi:murein DD-endopeptidase MepM/ murein hydrolase activator NlpD